MNGDTSNPDDEGSELAGPGRSRVGLPARALALALSMGACGPVGGEPGPESDEASITVFAASSLTEAMTALGHAYESSRPGTRVVLTFGGSQILRLQISQGAAADAFASANEAHLTSLISEGTAQRSQVLATNALALIVPRGLDGPVTSFEDLPRAQRIVIGSSAVPIGAYTRLLLDRTEVHFGPRFRQDVLDRVVSEESNVRLVRAKVELGEADAAFVYSTDALASDRSEIITIPPDVNVHPRYVIGGMTNAPSPRGRDAFLTWLQTAPARDILR
ncbi:MAG: molybdate ABC transporter substrate-binding protein, partial [Gemmatimonadetes bacterium]|nr:molybdate ABC transporter substrate-binding protein [Gemmatimonadota bacterium]